jgi:hypothetical protein
MGLLYDYDKERTAATIVGVRRDTEQVTKCMKRLLINDRNGLLTELTRARSTGVMAVELQAMGVLLS